MSPLCIPNVGTTPYNGNVSNNNLGTPRKSFSRANSVGSSDPAYPLHQSTSTMPVPVSRRTRPDPDVNKNYNTFAVSSLMVEAILVNIW